MIEFSSTIFLINTPVPIIEFFLIIVFPPSIVAFAYIVTLSSIVGCLLLALSLLNLEPRVTP